MTTRPSATSDTKMGGPGAPSIFCAIRVAAQHETEDTSEILTLPDVDSTKDEMDEMLG